MMIIIIIIRRVREPGEVDGAAPFQSDNAATSRLVVDFHRSHCYGKGSSKRETRRYYTQYIFILTYHYDNAASYFTTR